MVESALDNESAELDFTAIFQCIHIHDVLGKRVQLKLEFDESRRVRFIFYPTYFLVAS
jgi:hypothetical protein